jgi:hypothetical protein
VILLLAALFAFFAAAGAPSPVETIPPEEDAAIQSIASNIAKSVTDAFHASKDGIARRDAHAKGHGCVNAKFTVRDDVPAALRVGVFAEPGREFPAWVRYSNGAGQVQKDSKGDGRGMAIKLMGVEGDKILDDERDAGTQDFVMINYPVFFVRNAPDYVGFVDSVTKTGSPLHFFIPDALPWHWHLHEMKIGLSISLQKVVDPLNIRYWSMTPYLLGSQAIKFSAAPCVQEERSPFAYPKSDPDRLRKAMTARLDREDACFDFMVQAQGDAREMPIEDPTIEWSEKSSPFVKVARVEIPQQTFDSPDQQEFCENLSFTPWHSLPEHRPLGGINRVRRFVYQTISKLRHGLNGAPRAEPVPAE